MDDALFQMLLSSVVEMDKIIKSGGIKSDPEQDERIDDEENTRNSIS